MIHLKSLLLSTLLLWNAAISKGRKAHLKSSCTTVSFLSIHDVNDELSEAYPKCQVMTYAPSDEMYGLEVLTNESFDYEMQGIVVDKSKPVNTIIYFGVKEMDE